MYLSESHSTPAYAFSYAQQHHHHPLPRPTRRRNSTHSFVPVRSRTNSPLIRYQFRFPPSNDASPATGALPAVARPYHQTDVSYVGAENQTTSLEEHYAQGGSSAMDAESDLYQIGIGQSDEEMHRAVHSALDGQDDREPTFRLRRLYLVHRVSLLQHRFWPHPISQFRLRG